MAEWLAANAGTIIVVLILAAVVTLVIRVLVRDKKNGRSCCGGSCEGCGGCAMHGSCNKK